MFKNPSPFYAPSVAAKFDMEKLAADNFWEWWKIYKDKPGIKEWLEQRGMPTEELKLHDEGREKRNVGPSARKG